MQETETKTVSRIQINGEELDIILLPMMTPAGCKVYKCGCVHNIAIDKWSLCADHKHVLKHVIHDFEQDIRIMETVFEIKNKIKNIINYIANVNKKVVKF